MDGGMEGVKGGGGMGKVGGRRNDRREGEGGYERGMTGWMEGGRVCRGGR